MIPLGQYNMQCRFRVTRNNKSIALSSKEYTIVSRSSVKIDDLSGKHFKNSKYDR